MSKIATAFVTVILVSHTFTHSINLPLYYEGQPLTKEDIRHASIVYLDRCQDEDFENCTWGDGDSLDRERVRDILTDKFNYSYSVLTSFNKGNWS